MLIVWTETGSWRAASAHNCWTNSPAPPPISFWLLETGSRVAVAGLKLYSLEGPNTDWSRCLQLSTAETALSLGLSCPFLYPHALFTLLHSNFVYSAQLFPVLLNPLWSVLLNPENVQARDGICGHCTDVVQPHTHRQNIPRKRQVDLWVWGQAWST